MFDFKISTLSEFLLFNIDPPLLRRGAMLILYYAWYIHINIPLEPLYLLKKTASKIRLEI
jgi:hypothetical protein